jgi:hypothetical protein
MSDLEIDLTSVAVEESYNQVTNKLQNIAYGPAENVLAGALLALREFAEDNDLQLGDVANEMELAKMAHIDKFECFHGKDGRYFERFQVHCRECEAEPAAVGVEA